MSHKLKHEIELLKKKYNFPGVTVAYILPDNTIETLAIGLSDLEKKSKMTVNSKMLAASIGKSFVGALVVNLDKEGKIKLDDYLSKWLGHYKWFSRLPNYKTIKLHHLLTHSSGISDHVHMESFSLWYKENWKNKNKDNFKPEFLIGFVLDQKPLFEPGKGWYYSDTGYILLGLVIEKATKSTYYKEVENRFLKPLNLTMTFPSDKLILPGLVAGYTSAYNTFGLPVKTTIKPGEIIWNPIMEWTGGGLISNSKDLAIWAKHLYEGRAMKGSYLDELLKSVPVDKEKPGLYYGAGVVIDRDNSFGMVLGHGGVIPGYSSSMRYYCKYKIAIAFQINTDIGVWDHSTNLVSEMEKRLAKIIIKYLNTKIC
ncbi:MAG: beta-lactamase family protein [Parachlamydiales bacterium]|nr:beta-lactamase family protein [Parachlamydiales bacterium]